jgi:hypothetical protein
MLRKGVLRRQGRLSAARAPCGTPTNEPPKLSPFLNCCRQACNLRNLNAGELQMAVKCTRYDRHYLLLPSTFRVQIGNTIVRILRHSTYRQSLEDLACQYIHHSQQVYSSAWASTTPPGSKRQTQRQRAVEIIHGLGDRCTTSWQVACSWCVPTGLLRGCHA